MEVWRNLWRVEQAAARNRDLEQVKDAIGKQAALFSEGAGSFSDADLRADGGMFASQASRGWWIVWMVLYR